MHKILIADDSSMNRTLLVKMLSAAGFNTYIAENGKEVLEILKTSAIDAVLMDIEMPVMNGKQALLTIRNTFDEPVRSLPVIAITAHNDFAVTDELLACGFNDVMVKPFQKGILATRIEAAINKKSTEHKKVKQPEILHSLSYLREISQGDAEFEKQMVSTFIELAEPSIKNMKSFLAENNYDGLKQEAHRFISQLAYVGAFSTSEISREIEEYCIKKVKLTELPDLIERLERHIDCIVKGLKQDYQL